MQEDSIWNFGIIEVEIHMEHSDIRRRLPFKLDISCTSFDHQNKINVKTDG